MKTLIMLFALIGAVLVTVILTRCVRKQKRSPLFAGLAMASYVAISAFTIGLMEAFGTLDVKFSRLAELFAKWFAGFGERNLLVTGIVVFLLCGACGAYAVALFYKNSQNHKDCPKIAEPLLCASIFAASCDASFLIVAKAGFGTVGRVSSLMTLISDMNAVKQTIAWIVCLLCSLLGFVLTSKIVNRNLYHDAMEYVKKRYENKSGRDRGNGHTIMVYGTHEYSPVAPGKTMTFRVERYSEDGWHPAAGISYGIAGCPLDDSLSLRKAIVDHPVYKTGETDENGEIEFISSEGGEVPVITFPEDKVYANAKKDLRIVIVFAKTDPDYGVICGYGNPGAKRMYSGNFNYNRGHASLALSYAEVIVMGNDSKWKESFYGSGTLKIETVISTDSPAVDTDSELVTVPKNAVLSIYSYSGLIRKAHTNDHGCVKLASQERAVLEHPNEESLVVTKGGKDLAGSLHENYDALNFRFEAIEKRNLVAAILLGCLALTAAIVLISATGIEFSRIL